MGYKLLSINEFVDERGKMRFLNEFNMGQIVRFYEILPANTTFVRGWQAHQKEKKWFHCLTGSFSIQLVEVDNFEGPSKNLQIEKVYLAEQHPSILEVSAGMATAIKAETKNSRLIVYSNFTVEQSKKDDYRYPTTTWQTQRNE